MLQAAFVLAESFGIWHKGITETRKGNEMQEKIMGLDWAEIQVMQNKAGGRQMVDLSKPGDYGADPIGDGKFRMVPSGDVVDFAERCARLAK